MRQIAAFQVGDAQGVQNVGAGILAIGGVEQRQRLGYDLRAACGIVFFKELEQTGAALIESDARLTTISCESADCRAVIGITVPASGIWLKEYKWVSFKLENTGVVLIRMGGFITS